MKNLTIALDDETYRNARIRAAEQGTSVSAMVKRFLSAGGAPSTGVREMPMSFTHAPAVVPLPVDQGLPPGAYGRLSDGTPYYTKDGKPRKPGAMRHLAGTGWTEDFDSWPTDILASFEAWSYDAPDYKPDSFDDVPASGAASGA